jgi:endonuclease/exonuclease/phosphatase family metal-dependent hydrolase
VRIGVWNCRGAFARYGNAALAELQPDVLVVPEARATALANGGDWLFEYQPNLDKGTGILVRRGWTAERVDPPDGAARRWVLPVRLTPPEAELPTFVVLAFWAVGPSRHERVPSYSAQFTQLLDTWSDVIATESTVIAGDFNASAKSSSPVHLRNVATAEALKLASAYHAFHHLGHGAETRHDLAMGR